MKKNLKIVSLAAAALLAVSPVVASGVVNPGSSVVKADANNLPKNGSKVSSNTTTTHETTSTSSVVGDSGTGYPYFVEGKKVVTSGEITLKKGQNNVKSLADAITKKYAVASTGTSKPLGWLNPEGEIRSSIEGENSMTVNSDGSFSAPANTFQVTLRALNANGNTNFFTVYVNAYNAGADYSSNPVIHYNGQNYDHDQEITLSSNAPYNYVPLNGTVDTAAIQKAFTAKVSATDSNILTVSVDTSKVNTAVAGQYPVSVTAKSPNGNSVTVTFKLTVGEKGATYQTVNSVDSNSTIPVYSIDGNNVSTTPNTIKGGTQVATFGTVSVNGISYTRINSATANQFVLSSVFNKQQQPSTEQGETHRVMVDSKAYDKNGNYLGHDYAYNTNIDIVPTVVNINGKTYYKVAGKDEYVRVTNITGTLRRVRHNAYVYWSSYRRNWTGKIKYYRGQYVHTYGAAITFRNGKRYYRIDGCSPSNKRYLKVANF